MSESQPGPIRRVLVGVWNTVNFTRQLVFNLIFLLILFFVLVAIIGVVLSAAGLFANASNMNRIRNVRSKSVEDPSWENIKPIFDHLIAILPEFGLRLFQQPSGADLDRLGLARAA